MSAALAHPPQPKSAPKSTRRVSPQATPLAEVRNLPSSQASWPLWLRSLYVLQWCSGGIVLLVGGGVLSLYGLTALTEYQWGQTFANLNQLQQQERQLQIAQQSRRYQVANSVEQNPAGLVRQTPKQVLFIPGAPTANLSAVDPTRNLPLSLDNQTVGY